MTAAQARSLGHLIRKARTARGWTQLDLADALGVGGGWIAAIEGGTYRSTSPERLARISELLHIEPAAIDRITRGSISKGLPEVGTYFRAKYNLTSDEVARIERYVKRFTERDD